MAEQNQNPIQQIFFSKDTISGLNKNLLQEGTLQNLSRDGKQEVINLLVKNMKTVYKNLDTSKINKTNFGSIFDQFKKISVSHTLSDIKKQNIVGVYQQSPSDLKFQRDFTSNPNKGNQLMDRPEPTKQIELKSGNHQMHNVEQHRRQNMDPFTGFSSDMGNYDSNLDAAFRPIVDSLTDQDAFNNYDTGRNLDDVKTRMNSIQQARDSELNQRNARPTTPEFLKSKKTNIRANNDDNLNKGKIPSDNERQMGDRHGPGQVPDFKNLNPSHFNNSFNGLSNDTGDNLFSLDNIDRPLIEGEIVEDNSSFEDRLKRLQSDRDNFSQPNPNRDIQPKDIDFTSNNFPSTDMGNNSVNYNMSRENNSNNSNNSQDQQMKQAEIQRQQQMKQAEIQRQQQLQQKMQQQQQQMQQQQMQQQQMYQQPQKQVAKTLMEEWVNVDDAKTAVILAFIALIILYPMDTSSFYSKFEALNRFHQYDIFIRALLFALILYILFRKFKHLI